MIAESGTPFGASNWSDKHGQLTVGAVNLLLGCAPLMGLPSASFISPFQGLPFQSSACFGGFLSKPSHHTVSSSRFSTTFVKIVPFLVDKSALGLDFILVPGATPKNPFSGLTAQSLPSSPTLIQAISSPTHQHL